MANLKENTLKAYWAKMTKTKSKDLPYSQGYAIKMILGKYDIKPIQFAYTTDLVGIETAKQKLIWRDKGLSLEFLGLIDK